MEKEKKMCGEGREEGMLVGEKRLGEIIASQVGD